MSVVLQHVRGITLEGVGVDMTQDLVHQWNRKLFLPFAILATLCCGFVMAQATFEDLFDVAEGLNDDAMATQAEIDEIENERSEMFNDYRLVLKQIDGQKVYNRQLQLVVNKQLDKIAELKQSIEEVTSIQREITPLMLRTIEAIDQFISLDLPFDLDERLERVDKLRALMDNPDVAVSEKFSQVLRAFQIESEYGRTIGASTMSIELNGQETTVDVLRIGRIALMYQTGDAKSTGWWNPDANSWEELDNSFTTPIRNGLKIARKQLSQSLIRVPIFLPEASSAGGN